MASHFPVSMLYFEGRPAGRWNFQLAHVLFNRKERPVVHGAVRGAVVAFFAFLFALTGLQSFVFAALGMLFWLTVAFLGLLRVTWLRFYHRAAQPWDRESFGFWFGAFAPSVFGIVALYGLLLVTVKPIYTAPVPRERPAAAPQHVMTTEISHKTQGGMV